MPALFMPWPGRGTTGISCERIGICEYETPRRADLVTPGGLSGAICSRKTQIHRAGRLDSQSFEVQIRDGTPPR
jgi:hypothetical protein